MERINLGKENCYLTIYDETNIPSSVKIEDKNLFDELWKLHPLHYKEYKMYGRDCKYHRYFQSYGKDYKFTNMNHEHLPIEHPFFKNIIDFVSNQENTQYNELLVNWYETGEDWTAFHSDPIKELVPNSSIWSFTYYDFDHDIKPHMLRKFSIRPKLYEDRKEEKINPIIMKHNTCLVMHGNMQENYEHSVPKTKRSPLKRINITVRCFPESRET